MWRGCREGARREQGGTDKGRKEWSGEVCVAPPTPRRCMGVGMKRKAERGRDGATKARRGERQEKEGEGGARDGSMGGTEELRRGGLEAGGGGGGMWRRQGGSKEGARRDGQSNEGMVGRGWGLHACVRACVWVRVRVRVRMRVRVRVRVPAASASPAAPSPPPPRQPREAPDVLRWYRSSPCVPPLHPRSTRTRHPPPLSAAAASRGLAGHSVNQSGARAARNLTAFARSRRAVGGAHGAATRPPPPSPLQMHGCGRM